MIGPCVVARASTAQPITAQARISRRGAILPLVLLLVMLLSLSALTFSELMRVEAAAVAGGRDLRQLRFAAESGIETFAALLESGTNLSGIAATSRLQQVPLSRDDGDFLFTVGVRPDTTVGRRATTTLTDESSKLNLLALPLGGRHRNASRARLMALPGADEQIADAILDWLDADDTPSEFGVESEWYSSRRGRIPPRQGPIDSLDELLAVRGVTPELLYGRSTPKSSFETPQNEIAWRELLTLRSCERNVRRDGRPRIHLNQTSLVRLYDEVEAEFGAVAAKFVVAYRLNGDAEGIEAQRIQESKPKSAGEAQEELNDKVEAAKRRAARQQAGGSDFLPPADGPSQTRGGLDLGRRAAYEIRSVWDLVGSLVRIDVNHQDTMLKSPWQVDRDRLSQTVAMLEEALSPLDQDRIAGRIRVSLAPRPVLLSVPGWTAETVDKVLATRERLSGPGTDSSLAWLLTEGIVELRQLRELAPYLTSRGDVWSGTAWGHRQPHAGPMLGLRFVLDGTRKPARLVELVEVDPTSTDHTHTFPTRQE